MKFCTKSLPLYGCYFCCMRYIITWLTIKFDLCYFKQVLASEIAIWYTMRSRTSCFINSNFAVLQWNELGKFTFIKPDKTLLQMHSFCVNIRFLNHN